MNTTSQWDWLASADGLLSFKECDMLLDVDLFDVEKDLLKNTFSGAAPKVESDNINQDDSLYPPSPLEVKPSRAELADDLLQQLENQTKPENVFPNWLEEKMELPFDHFENMPQVRIEDTSVPAPIAPYAAQVVPQPTEDLLREFETVYGHVELTHLTPPQSPPRLATQLLQSYAQQAQNIPVAPIPSALPTPSAEQWPRGVTPVVVPEYDCNPQALEELVRHRAAQLASPQPYARSASPSPRSSPHSSPPSSPRSSSTDDDWCMNSRPKPYSRPSDDRRSRKKEQNKNAATRYRQKKKAEVEVLLNEEQGLRVRHGELRDKCSDLQREIRYLKGLMRDLFKAKGLIK